MENFEIEKYLALHGSENAYTSQLLEDFYFLKEYKHYYQALNIYHLLFMTFIYQTVLKAREWRRNKFEDATILINFPRDLSREKILETSQAFDFSLIPERTFMQYLRLFDADDNLIGDCKKLVDDRNERSHANGNYVTDEYLFEKKINQYDNVLSRIHSLYKTFLVEILNTYLTDLEEDINISRDDLELYLISPQKLSLVDLQCLLGLCGNGNTNHENIKNILIEDYGFDEIARESFTEGG